MVGVVESRFRSFPQDARPCCDDCDVRFPEDTAPLLIIDPQRWEMSMFAGFATDISLAVSFFVVSCARTASRCSHQHAWAQLTVKFYLTYHIALRNFWNTGNCPGTLSLLALDRAHKRKRRLEEARLKRAQARVLDKDRTGLKCLIELLITSDEASQRLVRKSSLRLSKTPSNA